MAIEQKILDREGLQEALLGLDTPPFDLEGTLDVMEEIHALKREKRAIILGHWYMRDGVKLVADYLGDSLDLSRIARATDADIILFAGVHFMAETAKILNPGKKVLLPTLEAGCSLAESIVPADVRRLRGMYPQAAIATYINTSAAVKAETDVCVTSANARQVISKLPQHQVVFIPDQYMGANLKKELPEKEIITYDGACILHEQFTGLQIPALRARNPGLRVLSHYECDPSIIAQSDMHGGTNDMINYILRERAAAQREGKAVTFLLATECGLSSTLTSQFQQKGMPIDIVGPCHLCPYMKKVDIYNVRDALRDERLEITVVEGIRIRAYQSLQRMFELMS
ncbi:quinolinate synthase NadA [Candidatus Woesearchaeota archaeon]|nr:quinolinate synthase NadA [Candidatus Woesearchaeota archaeon]